jgi:hypothetical protein
VFTEMGAAASVRMVYNDALGWFKQYIDAEVSDSQLKVYALCFRCRLTSFLLLNADLHGRLQSDGQA